ncbi:MAG TPA: ABC transporter substrate-binding protein [Methylomirabilota bacterium]|nr:ABC transporter substrate-binding protein [Methylomirabilota bacterium]
MLRLIVLLFFAVGLVVDTPLRSSPLFAAETIAVSYQGPGINNLPVEIALRQGFFQEQNLDVKLIFTRSDVDRAALVTGDIDFTIRGSSTVLSAARGLPVRMLFVGTQKPFWALVVRPEVNSVKDLKGKIMGVAGMAGGHHIATRLILKEYGLDPDRDAVFRVIGAGSRVPALMSGAMDAGLLEYGEAFRAKKSGFKILLNAADHYSVLNYAVGANLKKLREQPDQVKRFLRANVKGLKFTRDNRSIAVETIMSQFKLDRETADGIYQLSINNFTKDGTIDEAALKLMVDQQLAEAKVKEVPLSQMVDLTLLRQVLKEAPSSQ